MKQKQKGFFGKSNTPKQGTQLFGTAEARKAVQALVNKYFDEKDAERGIKVRNLNQARPAVNAKVEEMARAITGGVIRALVGGGSVGNDAIRGRPLTARQKSVKREFSESLAKQGFVMTPPKERYLRDKQKIEEYRQLQATAAGAIKKLWPNS